MNNITSTSKRLLEYSMLSIINENLFNDSVISEDIKARIYRKLIADYGK